jgi:hypothetical protein
MDISLTGSVYLLLIAIIGIVIVVIIAIVLYRKRSKNDQHTGGEAKLAPYPLSHRLDYQPEAKPVPVFKPMVTPAPQAQTVKRQEIPDIDLTRTRKDLTESLGAIVEKYSLRGFTIATADGLLFGSSGGDTAQTDAATYSEIFKNDPLVETTGVVLFGFTHKGSDLIGIIRPLSIPADEIVQQIEADTKIILNWWI